MTKRGSYVNLIIDYFPKGVVTMEHKNNSEVPQVIEVNLTVLQEPTVIDKAVKEVGRAIEFSVGFIAILILIAFVLSLIFPS